MGKRVWGVATPPPPHDKGGGGRAPLSGDLDRIDEFAPGYRFGMQTKLNIVSNTYPTLHVMSLPKLSLVGDGSVSLSKHHLTHLADQNSSRTSPNLSLTQRAGMDPWTLGKEPWTPSMDGVDNFGFGSDLDLGLGLTRADSDPGPGPELRIEREDMDGLSLRSNSGLGLPMQNRAELDFGLGLGFGQGLAKKELANTSSAGVRQDIVLP